MAMSRTRKIVLIISGIVIVLLLVVAIGIALLVAAFRNSAPTVANNSVLELRIEGALPDYAPEDPLLNRFFGNDDSSLTNLLTQLRKAKVDKRIGAVLLDIDSTAAGWGKADELRDAIADFRLSGKPVYAYMESGGNKEYYIATSCDRIYVAPAGDLSINGLAANAMFLRGSLDKLGVYPDFYQIGKYKNAPDQYTRKEMSEAQREVVNALLDDRFNRFIDTIATARGRSSEDVRTLIDNAPLRAGRAQEAGLIDGARYREEVENELKQRLNYKESDRLPRVKAAAYRGVTPESLGLNTGERVAVIYASGGINSGKSGSGPFDGPTVGSDTVAKAIRDARDDKAVRAIVLRVDSPGGSALASDMIWQAVESAKQKKPVVASMSDVAASGGYYISTNANRIVAEPSTITGSIGVFAGKPVLKGFYDWIGVNSEYVLRGKNAGLYRETEPFTPAERAKFEETVRAIYYDDFLPKVARGRNRDVEYIHSIAQGRVWSGAQAKERGLIDEFGGLDRAVEVAKQLANIPADKGVRRVIFPAPRTFLEQILGGSDDESTSLADRQIKRQQQAAFEALPEDIRRTLRYAAIFDRMKRGEVMALMPFDLQIK